ncbi:hypothetical protein WSK_0514 [Novosphingobium sp. Rr 2-17]|uniref:hypothetical protein n=1 Tax=Novosphingobium sp. Rr 2-17 TaxID=555793 RepID=UPI0002699E6D|nr:hypothetical protein [Novosphingobium sp. Rr 2-17]EIZ80832.1 hypothetical protein WSK_0514 [Novosphingobium sp. Rr 2-17]
MTIRFSAARGGTTPAIDRALCPCATLDAANDNARAAPPVPVPGRVSAAVSAQALGRRARDVAYDAPILPDALRHFARHGLSAALQASLKAEAAMAAGDKISCTRWLSICRQFDRRMAEATARSLDRQR